MEAFEKESEKRNLKKITLASVFSFGGEVGHQWVWNSGFLVDVFAGLGFATGGDSLNGLDSTTIGIGVSLGYAW